MSEENIKHIIEQRKILLERLCDVIAYKDLVTPLSSEIAHIDNLLNDLTRVKF